MNRQELDKVLKKLERELYNERLIKTPRGKPLIQKERCVAYWTMQSILVTHDLEYCHWRELRKGDYFKVKDSILGEISRIKFTIQRVRQYKSSVGWVSKF